MGIALSLVADLVLVVVFAILGRASHGEGLDPAAISHTAWPFLVGCVVGWAATLWWVRGRHNPKRPSLAQGALVVAATVIVGNVVRVMAGGTTHWSFILVTVITLVILLLGWRLVARWGFAR